MLTVNLKLYFLSIALSILRVHGQAPTGTLNGSVSQTEIRQLQQMQTLKYRATYKADFQHLVDPSCDVSSPAIGVQCYGSNMTILSTSDSTITCTLVPGVIGTFYYCISDCNDDYCESVYRARNASNFFDGPFGSVTFMCEGHESVNVTSHFFYLGENTTCTSSSNTTQTRSYHVGRLGLSCPVGSSREFVFDDTYSECYSLVSPINTAENSNDVYTCISGRDCGGQACDVTIDNVNLYATSTQSLDACIETTTEIVTTSPTPSPVQSSFDFAAQFEANWAVLYDSEEALSCTSTNGGAIISCENGSFIKYLNSTDTEMACTMLNGSELHCIGSEDSIRNQFTRVDYECAGPVVPSSRVTFLKSDSVCASVSDTVTVSHVVAMGVICSFLGSFHFDIYTECAHASHQFYGGRDEFLFNLDFLTCGEAVSFTLNTATIQQIIPNVTIRTDDVWLTIPDDRCITITPAAAKPVSSAPIPVPSPSASPNNLLPISSTKEPTAIPIASRETPPTSTSMNQSTDSSDNGTLIGVVVGSVGGGFLVTALIGYFVFLRKRDTNSSSSSAKLTAIADVSHASDSHVVADLPPAPQSQPTHVDVISNRSTQLTPAVVESSPVNAGTAHMLSPSGGYVVDLKDQCRSVIFMPHNGKGFNDISSRPSNVDVTESTENTIPMAVAYGVSSTSAGSQNTNRSEQQEPPGRQFMDM